MKQTVPVSKRALIQRINRALHHDGQRLRTARNARTRLDLGDYYVVDVSVGGCVDAHVDLEDLGRELKVLNSWEALDEE